MASTRTVVETVTTTITAVSQSPCQTCGATTKKRFTCVQCNNLAFCGACWPKWVLHAPGQVGWGGKPHEKADPAVVERFQQIFEPQRTESQLEADLYQDNDTTWFGISRDVTGQPTFHDYGRFASLMEDSAQGEAAAGMRKYPQLVSFIGETGAGKSTLIKLLIERQLCEDSSEGSDSGCDNGQGLLLPAKLPSPVSSAGHHDRVATTGDVHLYADPATFSSNAPLLLADCEGFNGGEVAPRQVQVGARVRHPNLSTFSFSFSGENRDRSYNSSEIGNHMRTESMAHGASQRSITWAKTPHTKKREYAVAQLYPRILYTFSDVIVFVLRNPRAFESTVLDKLVNWGAASIDKSINQPCLPRAIIVFNATDNNTSLESEWDIPTATRRLMDDIQGAVTREPALQEHVKAWQKRGKTIRTTSELLACYYSSVDVVRMPYKGGNYILMNDQAGKLDGLIKTRCAESHWKKRQVRMLPDSEKLQIYLQGAYDHFTKDLNKPFDFVKEALRHSPVPRNFEGNVLNLAIAIRDRCSLPEIRDNAQQIFLAMTPMIASCVMFDAVRQNLLGTVERLFEDRYAKAFLGALDTFASMYWPCEYRKRDSTVSEGDNSRCCNVRSGHNPKGHQNRYGKIIGAGSYESTLDLESFKPRWMQLLRTCLMALQGATFELGQQKAFQRRTELQVAASLHRERINEFYQSLGSATDFISHSACLSCLRELPECALPCGHVLCFPCLEVFGTRTSRTTIEISRCPLHYHGEIAIPPWIIATKPAHAGVRVLSLDGGGVRGIVQLQVLKEIEKVLGPGLPIQSFFDLIVGSGTGGIIATALGTKSWSLDTVMEKFTEMCQEAFKPREMTSVPLVGALSSLYHGSLYKNQPLKKTLVKHFSERPMFGGFAPPRQTMSATKVAVISTSVLTEEAVVFANYNRPDPAHEIPYNFVRPDTPATEMEMWEAVHAAVAAPTYFKPFLKSETGRQYVDMHHRCPIWVAHHEAKSIWGDVSDSPPDILLSLGTGRNIGDTETIREHRRVKSASSRASLQLSRTTSQATRRPSNFSTRTMTRSSVSSFHDIEEEEESAPKTALSGLSTCTGVDDAMSEKVIRSGRGGAGNYKKVTKATSTSDLRGLNRLNHHGSGYFVRDPKTPLLVTLQTPQGGDYRHYDHKECETTWDDFMSTGSADATSDDPGTDGAMGLRNRDRFVRICPEFSADRLPKMDNIHRMGDLEQQSKIILQQHHFSEINEIAHMLIASSFLFEKNPASVKQTSSGSFTCSGIIFCRFRLNTPELYAMGNFLKACLTHDFEPYFVIEEQNFEDASRWSPVRQILLTAETIDRFQARGYFRVEPLEIHTFDEKSETNISLCIQACPYPSGRDVLPISGFPRRLIIEDRK